MAGWAGGMLGWVCGAGMDSDSDGRLGGQDAWLGLHGVGVRSDKDDWCEGRDAGMEFRFLADV